MLARWLASLLTFSCLVVKSSSACCCTRKYASEFCREFLSPSASCRSTSDRCHSTWSWDSRRQTDSGSEFEELVPAVLASNSNTKSMQDCGVFSLSTRSFLSPFLETNRVVSLSWTLSALLSLPLHGGVLFSNILFAYYKRNKQTHHRFSLYYYMKLISVNQFISKVDRIKLPSLLLPSTST